MLAKQSTLTFGFNLAIASSLTGYRQTDWGGIASVDHCKTPDVRFPKLLLHGLDGVEWRKP